VSVDAVENNTRLADLLDLPFPVLSDPDKRAAQAYGVLIGRSRATRRWTFYIGADGRVLYIDREVAADGHGEEVPARLLALGIRRRPALSPVR
jgi:thioredoxin-dependent peroxiredoxin